MDNDKCEIEITLNDSWVCDRWGNRTIPLLDESNVYHGASLSVVGLNRELGDEFLLLRDIINSRIIQE